MGGQLQVKPAAPQRLWGTHSLVLSPHRQACCTKTPTQPVQDRCRLMRGRVRICGLEMTSVACAIPTSCPATSPILVEGTSDYQAAEAGTYTACKFSDLGCSNGEGVVCSTLNFHSKGGSCSTNDSTGAQGGTWDFRSPLTYEMIEVAEVQLSGSAP